MIADDTTGRLPPNYAPAERELLGAIFRESHLLDEIVAAVKGDDFYVHGHQLIFDALVKLAEKGKRLDIASVGEFLLKKKQLEDVGGAEYLAKLWDESPASGHWKHHAEIIVDRAMRRKLIRAGMDLVNESWDLGTEAPEILAGAERSIGELTERAVSGESVSLQQAMSETYERLDARRGSKDISGVPTGFERLDDLLCGFQPSELIIIGARPSVGKTAFGINIARFACLECNTPTLFVSLEQARTEISERLLCVEGKIDSHKLRRGHMTPTDESDLIAAGERLSASPFWIDDNPIQDIMRIAANARRMKRKHGIKFLMLDYLQLIDSDKKTGANRQEQVSAISRRLKGIARELKIPVVALCQVNRGPEDRSSKEPRLSDLRESGAIEQDADTVLMLHRVEDVPPSQVRMDVIVAKQRNGPIGRVELIFEKRYMRFCET